MNAGGAVASIYEAMRYLEHADPFWWNMAFVVIACLAGVWIETLVERHNEDSESEPDEPGPGL